METFDLKLPNADQNVMSVYRSNADGRHPLVIYCHGWGGDRSMNEVQSAFAEALVAGGAALLQFDFFGCGDTGGDFSAMSYGRWTDNLADVFDWAAAQAWVDPKRIALIGCSSGTTAVLRFAARDKRPLCAVSIATCIGHFIGMGEGGPTRTLLQNLDGLQAGGTAPVFGKPFPMGFFRDFLADAPVHTVKDIQCPVFFLAGTADNAYRRADGWLGHLIRQGRGLPSRHHEVEGGDHELFNLGEIRNGLIMDHLKAMGFFGAAEKS